MSSENMENIPTNSTDGEIPIIKNDEPASLEFTLGVIAVIIIINLLYEVVYWYYIYQHDDYKEKCEKARNLSKRLRDLNDQQVYGGGSSTKDRQNAKMIKVQNENFRQAHA